MKYCENRSRDKHQCGSHSVVFVATIAVPKSGMAKLEEDIENPDKSAVFSKYPKLIKDHHIMHFICDTLRTAVAGVVAPHDLDAMLENDIDIHHHEALAPPKALATVSDALPGLGIVAAVLGVVITMGALGGPPEEIGHKVAAALVGTFLGILFSYGVVSPIAANLEKTIDARRPVLSDAAGGSDGLRQRDGADDRRGICPPRIPHELRPRFKDDGSGLQRRRGRRLTAAKAA